MADERRPGVVWSFSRRFFGSIGLIFFPLPFGVFRRQLAGKWVVGGKYGVLLTPKLCVHHTFDLGGMAGDARDGHRRLFPVQFEPRRTGRF